MSKVLAVPVSVGSVTIHVAKGRRWSVVEHLLLDAVCREPRTAEALAKSARLPERMVVEAMINLMRAGWVELVTEDKVSLFAATTGGRANVGRDDLPAVTRLVRRPVRYAIDRVSGSVLRYRELDFVWASRFRQMKDQVDAIIEPAAGVPEFKQIEVIGSMLYDDEEYRGVVPGSARIGEGYALVHVVNGRLRGLASAPEQLVAELLGVAARNTSPDRPERLADVRARPARFTKRQVSFSIEDLVLGGDAHKELLVSAIKAANASITVHSTFVGGGASEEILELMQAAASRGVRVDILWGKVDSPDGANATRDACAAINQRMKKAGLEQFIRAHPFSTASHAKVLVADDGKGGFVAALGSCNWLSTGFASFEVSVRSGDPLLVSDIMEALAQMAMAVTGLNGGVAAQLAGQAINIRKHTLARPARRAEARIILGPEHGDCVLAARDEAKAHIVLGSHRMGRSANNLSIRPTRAAVNDHQIDAALYYGQLSDGMTAEQAAELRITHGAAGLRIRQISDPRMHAKFVAWDDDNVVVTSQNLLSADPAADFAELGIHIRATGAARALRERLQLIFRQ